MIRVSRRWTSEVVSTKTSYGKIPHDDWFQPDWIDEDKATKSRLDMIEHKVNLLPEIQSCSDVN